MNFKQRIFNNPYFKGKELNVVSVFFNETGKDYYLTKIRHLKRELETISCTRIAISIEELLGELQRSCHPVCLHLQGKGVRGGFFNETDDSRIYLKKFGPSLRLEDFELQCIPIQNGQVYVGIIHKSQLEGEVALFKNKKLPIVKLFWGGGILGLIWENIDVLNTAVIFNEQISLNNQNQFVAGIVHETPNVRAEVVIGGIRRSIIEALHFSIASIFFIHPLSLKEGTLESDFLYKRLWKITGVSYLLIALSVLLVNFFVFLHYSNLYQLNRQRQPLFEQLSAKVVKKALKYNEIKSLGYLGNGENSHLSFYADRLAAVTPEEIIFNVLSVNPLKSKIKTDKKIMYMYRLVLIKGQVGNSEQLYHWIDDLRNIEWVKSVLLEDYSKNDQDTFASFSMKIEVGE